MMNSGLQTFQLALQLKRLPNQGSSCSMTLLTKHQLSDEDARKFP